MAKSSVKVKLKNPLSSENLPQVYASLLEAHGHQHWWPGETPLEVSVGAILTQNTSWANVEKAIVNLKKAGVLEAEKLYQMREKDLAELIRPAGYFNLKARRLMNFMKYIWAEYHGDFEIMKQKSSQVLRRELLAVNGIGPETADSILLYSLSKTSFVIDAYTNRIFSRHKLRESGNRSQPHLFSNYDALKQLFEKALLRDLDLYQDFHAQIVLTAKRYCHSHKVDCDTCPLAIYL